MTWLDDPLVLQACDSQAALLELANVRRAEGRPDGEYTHCVFSPGSEDAVALGHVSADEERSAATRALQLATKLGRPRQVADAKLALASSAWRAATRGTP